MSFSSRDQVIGRYLCLRRQYGLEIVRHAVPNLRPGGYLLDVGANIGTVCISPEMRSLFAKALAFEPDPTNFSLLSRNIKQNGLTDTIRAFQIGISDRDGHASLMLSRENYGDHRTALDGRGSFTFQIRRLDSLLPDLGVNVADVGLICLDVQGHELNVLLGATSLLEHRVPLLVEFWPHGLRDAGNDPEEFLDILRGSYQQWCSLGSGVSAHLPTKLAATSQLTMAATGVDDPSDRRAETDLLLL